MNDGYQNSVGGMWVRKDRNKRDYYYIQVEMGTLRYSFHAFQNKFKDKDTHPDFKVFALDGGEGKEIERRYRPPEASGEGKFEDKYKTAPPPEWPPEEDDGSPEEAGFGEQEDGDDDTTPF
ncbi:MAG: hypothetical protein ABIH23_27830 [bacterium]